jgi:hypothetical protein
LLAAPGKEQASGAGCHDHDARGLQVEEAGMCLDGESEDCADGE